MTTGAGAMVAPAATLAGAAGLRSDMGSDAATVSDASGDAEIAEQVTVADIEGTEVSA